MAAHNREESCMKLLEISAQIHPCSQHLFNAYIQSGFASGAWMVLINRFRYRWALTSFPTHGADDQSGGVLGGSVWSGPSRAFSRFIWSWFARPVQPLFLRVSHLPLGVVEKVLVQLSICQRYDDAGSAITCTQKDSGSSCLTNNRTASFILLLFCKIKWICQLRVFLWWFSDFDLIENRDILCSHCLIFSSGGSKNFKTIYKVSCFLELWAGCFIWIICASEAVK